MRVHVVNVMVVMVHWVIQEGHNLISHIVNVSKFKGHRMKFMNVVKVMVCNNVSSDIRVLSIEIYVLLFSYLAMGINLVQDKGPRD